MKKLNVLLILLFSAVLITGCYDDNKNATVRINLGNMPVAKNIQKRSFIDRVFSVFVKDAYAQTSPLDLIKLHVAAVKDGKVLSSIDFTKDEIDSEGSIVELPVPEGVNIAIIAVGEISGGYDVYYDGLYTNLVAGEEKTISLTMGYLESRLAFIRAADDTNASWTGIPGVIEYVLYRDGIEVYRGKNSIWYGDPNTGFDLNVSFGVANITYNYGW